MGKLIVVLLDGCNADTAQECMGYLSALVAEGLADYTPHACALPALSRPLYHYILTGVLPCHSGIVHNTVAAPPCSHLFSCRTRSRSDHSGGGLSLDK